MERYGLNLNRIAEQSFRFGVLRRVDAEPGDMLYVKTCNSLYCIRVEEERGVVVSGGWFERSGSTPARTTIAGCTRGGSVIKVDVIAAVGLCLEFGNRVTTSPVQSIILLRRSRLN